MKVNILIAAFVSVLPQCRIQGGYVGIVNQRLYRIHRQNTLDIDLRVRELRINEVE